MRPKWLMTILLLAPLTGISDVGQDLGHYFDELGFASNTTSPHAYSGQQAGYYSGGSLYARDSVRNLQIMEVDLPSFRSGCGGIDLFAGGMSFVKGDQIVNTMRNVLSNAGGYAFTLAMEEVTPEIANTMKYIQDMANKVNAMNINSCETAESLVGGMWPKTRAAQQQVCQDVGRQTGLFDDWAQARQECNTGKFSDSMARGKSDPRYKNMTLDSGNIAWHALKANSLTNSDTSLAELFMSLSATIVIQKKSTSDDSGTSIRHLKSLATDPSMLRIMLEGGSTKLYQCDEPTECLNPQIRTVTVDATHGLKSQVSQLLGSMRQKIVDDQKLTGSEIGLLQATRIPIYKILNVQSAYQGALLDVESYSDVIATDILFQYLEDSLHIVHTASLNLQYPEHIMHEFNESVNNALSEIRVEQNKSQQKISMAMQLTEQTQFIEQMLAGQLSVRMGNTLSWARSMR